MPDLFGFKVTVTKKHITSAQRQSRYRHAELLRDQQRQARFEHLSDVTLARYMADESADPVFRRELWLEFGRRNAWR